MKKAAAIVTDRGGRTCHAAIVARELGIPAIVGAAGATQTFWRAGRSRDRFLRRRRDRPRLCRHHSFRGIERVIAAGSRGRARRSWSISAIRIWRFETAMRPNDGVGLARMEFIINDHIGIHPMALANPDKVTSRPIASAWQI